MTKVLKLSILTPEKQLYKGDIKNVITRGLDGSFEVLPNHVPMVAVLIPTITEFTDIDGKRYKAFTSSGILKVRNDEAVMLCDAAEWPEDIDVERAKAARERAEKRLKEKDKIDVKRAQVSLLRSLMRLKLNE